MNVADPQNSNPPSHSHGILGHLSERWPRWRTFLLLVVGLALAVIVGLALRKLLQEVRYDNVMDAVRATPGSHLIAALIATAISYAALTQYDASALRYAGVKVARSTVFLTSFVAYALTNTIGLGPLSGGAVRMRLYTAAGLEPGQIARIIGFNAAAFFLGMLAFGAVGLLWGAPHVAHLVHLNPWVLRLLAAGMLGLLTLFFWLCSRQRILTIQFGPTKRWRFSLRLPPLKLALIQLVISALELTASGLVLWFLLPDNHIHLETFMALYAIAIAAGIISHVPGGVGVFEAVMLLASGRRVPSDAMLGALLLNRGIYYLLPLVLATFALIAYELRSGVAAPVGRMAVHLSPRLLAALTLVAGLWLLVSGATPFTPDAREAMEALKVPVSLIEASHFLGSVAGLGLLLVARGLLHRLDGAWWSALGLSVFAAILALPKGLALSELAMLSVLVVLLVISRHQFTRRSSLLAQRLEPEWLLAVAGVVGASIWVLFFAYQEVDYSNHLWWQFEIDGQAPRSLRAMMGVALLALGYGLWQLLRPPSGNLARPTPEEIEKAAAIVRKSSNADGCLALVGDKHLLFSPSGKSFLMFGKQGRSWVSLYGPVGERREWADLVWQFIEMASSHGGRPAFYQIRPNDLPLYLDCGLHALKLGEFAQVSLPDFSLKGAKRANLRSGVNRGEREGLEFEVLPPETVHTCLPELRQVSDAWLSEQQGREKCFSVGRFDPAYLARMPVAVVRREGELIAFASLLVTDVHHEATVDLMRHRPGVPPGTMDFLFAKVMLHLQAEGYQRFGLGMSPLAGMAERRRAPRWQRLGKLLYKYGDRFYHFRGLRNFKDKFEPEWEPRYLATQGGISPILVLADVAALIGGGMKGVISK